MIIGVRGDNKEFHPHIVTYIFNLCGESNSGEEKIVNIGSFELNYKYYVFETDSEIRVKNKILRNFVPCRIALILESTSYYYPYTNCMGIFNNKKRILTLKEALIMLRYTINHYL